MNIKEKFDQLLQEFGAHVGIEHLRTSDEGVCTLSIDGRLLLNFLVNPNDGTLIVWCLLGEVSPADRSDKLAALLRANLFWHETGGATLSLMPDSDDAVLAIRYPLADIDAERLQAITEQMVEQAEHFMNMLERAAPEVTVELHPHSDHAIRV